MASATILVVDDDVVLLEGVSKLLDRRGFNVIPAASAHEALEIVRTGPPIDLILSDVVMPEMHGPQLIREVRELSPQTAALLMTGGFVKSADTIPKSVAVVKKPFTTAELVFAVQSVLAQSAALSEELRERCEISVKLGQEGGRLRSEAEAAVRKSILLRERRKRKRAPDV